eukprot:6471773-Amphidinium_carterae.1
MHQCMHREIAARSLTSRGMKCASGARCSQLWFQSYQFALTPWPFWPNPFIGNKLMHTSTVYALRMESSGKNLQKWLVQKTGWNYNFDSKR